MYIDTTTLPALRATQPLRDLHRVNAAFSRTTGIAIVATSGWLSRQIDLPRPVLVALGVGLVGWSVLLVLIAVLPRRRLVSASTLVAAGDAAWVFASIALAAVGDLTGLGTAVVIGAAIVVGAFAVEGLVLGRWANRHAIDDRAEVLFHGVDVAAPPTAAWQMVLDADLYARLAPNLTSIEVASDQCTRTCTDTRGNSWSEAMRLDHDRHVQQIDVDLAGHPMALDRLAATIRVGDAPIGSRIEVAFVYVTRSTMTGLLTSLILPLAGRRLLHPIARGWSDHAATLTTTRLGLGSSPRR